MTEIATGARIFVAGHGGLVGSAVVRRLEGEGFSNILTATRDQLDLRDQAAGRRGAVQEVDGQTRRQRLNSAASSRDGMG